MSEAPLLLVSTGTLVPGTLLDDLPDPVRAVLHVALLPLYLPHYAGILPSPDRFMSDAAYSPLKKLGCCWVVPLPNLGLTDRDEAVKAYRAALHKMTRKHPGRPIIMVGQSQGALVVAEVACDPDLPETVVAVITAGGPFKGSHTPNHWSMRWSKAFLGVRQMVPGSESLRRLQLLVKTRWPRRVEVIICGSPGDPLVSLRSARGLAFPSGTPVKEVIFDEEMSDVEGRKLANHLMMCWRGSFLDVIVEVRDRYVAGANAGAREAPIAA